LDEGDVRGHKARVNLVLLSLDSVGTP